MVYEFEDGRGRTLKAIITFLDMEQFYLDQMRMMLEMTKNGLSYKTRYVEK